jgi:hypothetical protein
MTKYLDKWLANRCYKPSGGCVKRSNGGVKAAAEQSLFAIQPMTFGAIESSRCLTCQSCSRCYIQRLMHVGTG